VRQIIGDRKNLVPVVELMRKSDDPRLSQLAHHLGWVLDCS
jgi:hypothetical protein